ncbi:MAG TPA: endo-1,4-beta-xylanase [Verrucomicrobiae bacterium]|jgi:endo-1,4-beta-xylanase|nr:endo-1,4-beta-xylanase [Verrucomicrobiae bacterium]
MHQINRRQFLTGAMALALMSRRALAAGIFGHDASGEDGMTLARAASKRGLLFGSPLFPNDLQNGDYLKLFATQASILTNTVYMSVTQPTPETWNLLGFENVRAFAKKHKLKMRGHPLVWHQALPDWTRTISTPSQARQVLHDRIVKLAGRYKGEFQSWDVVNEAVSSRVKDGDHLVHCVWSKQLGVEYLDFAFHVAHDTDPHALLTYNDFGTEDDSDASQAKRELVFDLLNGMLKRKVPVHAIGLQSHLTGGATFKTLPQWIKRLKSLKLRVFITELDVNDKPFPSDKDERDKLVAKTYGDLLSSALNTGQIDIVLTWGLADPYSWLQSPKRYKRSDGLPLRPLPFGEKMEPTAAFYAMRSAFVDAPHRHWSW